MIFVFFFCAGLAKPSPVIETFCSDELVARYVKLDGVVTLVDCKHAMRHLDEVKPRWVVNEAVEQVAYADRIILNKVIVFQLISYFLHLASHQRCFSFFLNLFLLLQTDLVNEAELDALTDRIKVNFVHEQNFLQLA